MEKKTELSEDMLRIGRILAPFIREEIRRLRKDPKWQKGFAEWKARKEQEYGRKSCKRKAAEGAI